MTNLCITCEWIDQESQKRWAKSLAHAEREDYVQPHDAETGEVLPQFNSRYAFCTHENHRRRPTVDQVAGQHMDVVKITDPPWKTCRECRRFYGDDTPCPYWEERKNAN